MKTTVEVPTALLEQAKVTCKGEDLAADSEAMPWSTVRDAICEGRGS